MNIEQQKLLVEDIQMFNYTTKLNNIQFKTKKVSFKEQDFTKCLLTYLN